ncbi:FAD-dependent oxidoreductase [Paenibacillus mucilaginosus]|uniref:phytoene desaturase family protein n=1 Tax=Paenibacillus mucilaginosus TaxID=61624 RepID=UPI003D24E1ED
MFVREYGGRIRLGTGVKRLVARGGRVTGVETEAGETLPADEVVIGADFAHAMKHLLEPGVSAKYGAEQLKRKRCTSAGIRTRRRRCTPLSLTPSMRMKSGWYLQGGYAGLIGRLEEALRSRGVTIRTGTPVEEVLMLGSRCIGVWAGGEKLAFEHVVLNGDFPGTAALLGEQERGKAPARKYVPSSGCLLLYLGLNRTYPEALVHQFFFTEGIRDMLATVFVKGELPADPCIYAFHPSLIDPALPPGKSVLYVLVPVPSGGGVDWSGREAVVDAVLRSLERRGFPGLRAAVEWMKVRTPEDALAEGLFGGGSFGIAPSLQQSGVFRPQLAPFGIEGLYAVGASVHPGGGVPVVMQGAKQIADHILKKDCTANMHSI